MARESRLQFDIGAIRALIESRHWKSTTGPSHGDAMKSRFTSICTVAALCACSSIAPTTAPLAKTDEPNANIELFLSGPLEGRVGFDKASAYVEKTFGFGADADGQYTASRDKNVLLEDGYVLKRATMHKRTNSFSLLLSTEPCLSIDKAQELMDTRASTYSAHLESYGPYSNRNGTHVSAIANAPDYKCAVVVIVHLISSSIQETPRL